MAQADGYLTLIQAILWDAETLVRLTVGTPRARTEPRVVKVPLPPAFRKARAAAWLEDMERRSVESLQWEAAALADWQQTLRLHWQQELHVLDESAAFAAWMSKVDRRRRWLESQIRAKRAESHRQRMEQAEVETLARQEQEAARLRKAS